MADGYPNRIAYSLEVLDTIRAEAEAAYYRLARGGLETGGILFGKREGLHVRVTALRAVECEHALGPSFRLSENDLHRFEETVDAAATDPELEGLEAVGWYHSHTRSDIALTGQDLAISDRFFPDPGQIALVVRPDHFAPLRAGFFFREQDGSLQGSATLREFTVSPLRKPGAVRQEPQNGAGDAGQSAIPGSTPAGTQPGGPVQTLLPEPDLPSRYLPARHTGTGIPPWEPPAPARRRSIRPWLWISLSVLVLVAAGAAVGARFWFSGRNTSSFSLQVEDAQGQLRIEWDRNATPVLVGTDAAIEIEDGMGKSSVLLDAPRLRQGRIIYARRTGKVDVHMRVNRSGHLMAEEFAQYVGAPPAPPTSKPKPAPPPGVAQPPRDDGELAAQLENVRAELAQQSEEIRRLKGQSQVAAPAPQPLAAPPAPAAQVPSPRAPLTIYRAETGSAPADPDTASAPAAQQRRPAPLPVYAGPMTGRLVWTGQLKRGATVSIYGGHASGGRLAGQLPGVPVRLRVSPASASRRIVTVFVSDPGQAGPVEPATSHNGNNRIVYTPNRKYAGGITVLETPGTQNAWRALTLRSEEREISAFVVFWEVVRN